MTGRSKLIFMLGDILELSLLDLQIISNTLSGSLSIRDGGNIFTFKMEARKQVLDKMWRQMNEMIITTTLTFQILLIISSEEIVDLILG